MAVAVTYFVRRFAAPDCQPHLHSDSIAACQGECWDDQCRLESRSDSDLRAYSVTCRRLRSLSGIYFHNHSHPQRCIELQKKKRGQQMTPHSTHTFSTYKTAVTDSRDPNQEITKPCDAMCDAILVKSAFMETQSAVHPGVQNRRAYEVTNSGIHTVVHNLTFSV